MAADEETFDLFKLFMAVREKGGYDAVSKNDLWDLVAKESGFGSIISSTLKVLYIKYLNTLERWLEKVLENKDPMYSFSRNDGEIDFGEITIGLQAESDVEYLNKNDELYEHTKLTDKKFCEYDDEMVVKINRGENIPGSEEIFCNSLKREIDIHGTNDLCEGEDPITKLKSNVDKNSVDIEAPCRLNFLECGNVSKDKVERSVKFSNGDRKCDFYVPDNEKGVILDSTTVEEQNFSHERKYESMLGMVNWINGVAKNPCDPVIGELPERSKWKSYGNEEIWKQVLLVRDAMLLKRHVSSSAMLSASQKIHPCMFDDHQGSSYNLREKLKSREVVPSGKLISQPLNELSSGSSLALGMEGQLDKEKLVTTDSQMPAYMGKCASKRIPLGRKFQVEVPEWNDIVSESDPKWLGTLIWPLNKVNQAFLLGKGRKDSCECQVPGSTKCIQYHINEKRYELKMELGSAFDHWKFDRMGEEVTLCWTKKEEHKFKGAVRSSSASIDETFWTQIFKFFPSKSREDVICYYFNVFLLRRRGFQNRFTPDNIDSDDDYLEFESEKT